MFLGLYRLDFLASWICTFTFFVKFGKFLVIVFFFFLKLHLLSPHLWDSDDKNIYYFLVILDCVIFVALSSSLLILYSELIILLLDPFIEDFEFFIYLLIENGTGIVLLSFKIFHLVLLCIFWFFADTFYLHCVCNYLLKHFYEDHVQIFVKQF